MSVCETVFVKVLAFVEKEVHCLINLCDFDPAKHQKVDPVTLVPVEPVAPPAPVVVEPASAPAPVDAPPAPAPVDATPAPAPVDAPLPPPPAQ